MVKIEWIKRFRYPNSIGLFYSSATRFLGLKPLSDESQVMAAAAYGEPKWLPWINQKIIDWNADGDYTLLHNLERGSWLRRFGLGRSSFCSTRY